MREGAGNGRGPEIIDALRYLHDLEDDGPELAPELVEESQRQIEEDAVRDIEGEKERIDTSD